MNLQFYRINTSRSPNCYHLSWYPSEMSSPMRYFAFGSNMWVPRIEARLDRCTLVCAAWMDGWALRFHKRGRDGSGKCDAFRTDAPRDRLRGIVYELSAAQKFRLDDTRRQRIYLASQPGHDVVWRA